MRPLPLLALLALLSLSACTEDAAPPASPPAAPTSPELAAAADLLRERVDALAADAAPTSREVEEDEASPCGDLRGPMRPLAHHYTLRLRLDAPDSLPAAARLASSLEDEGWVRVSSPGRALQENPVSLRRDRLRITISGERAPAGEDAVLGVRGDTECIGPR